MVVFRRLKILRIMAKIKEGQYIVRLRHNQWIIFRATNVRSDSEYRMEGTGEDYPINCREQAIKRMYELNGWRYRS